MTDYTLIGKEFDGVLRYLDMGRRDKPSDKQAEILGSSGVSTNSTAAMIADFNLGRALNPKLGCAVWHTSLSFNPDDAAQLNSAKMLAIANGYLKKMGLENTQYVIVRHHDVAGNQHLHIIANRVDNEGNTIDDRGNFYRSTQARKALIAEFGLTPSKEPRPELQHPERFRKIDLARHELLTIIHQALATETKRPHLLAALRGAGIGVQERFDKEGKSIGISFEKNGYSFKGSALGRHLSSAGIDKQLAANELRQPDASAVPAVKTDPTPLTVSAAGSGTTPMPSTKGEPVKDPGKMVGQPAVGVGISNFIAMVQSSTVAGGQGRTASQESITEQASIKEPALMPVAQQEKELIADQEAQARRAARREELRRLLDLETEKMLANHKVRPATSLTEAKEDPISLKLSSEQDNPQPDKVQKLGTSLTNEKSIAIVESSAVTSITRQSAPVPHINEGTSNSGISPEVTLPIAPRRAVAIRVDERVLPPAVLAAVSKPSSIPTEEPIGASSPVVGIAASLHIQERETQPPIAKAISSPPTAAAVPTGVTSPSGDLTHTSESVVSRSPLKPAGPGAVVPTVEVAAQSPQSPEHTQKQISLMSLVEKLISEVPDLPDTIVAAKPVLVTATVVEELPDLPNIPVAAMPDLAAIPDVATAPIVPEAAWQYGIIRMLANDIGTSEERLSAVRAALLAAGATVGELVPPTPGRHKAPILPYSFDPTTASLEKISQILDRVQGSDKSKVQEQLHPWRQPTSVAEVDHIKWPDREGQFNQAYVLIDDPDAGSALAKVIADAFHSAGASIGEIKRDVQGLSTVQVSYHTHSPSINAINETLEEVNNSKGIEMRESKQNRDARYRGAVQVDAEQKEEISAKGIRV